MSVAVAAQPDAQGTVPEGHAHTPDAQICPRVHAVPHAPQLLVSVIRLVHVPGAVPHATPPDGQRQFPALQSAPEGHVVLHEPQCVGSLIVSTQMVAGGTVLGHTCWVGVQPHVPAMHDCVRWHGVPHAPQCAGSTARSTSQPSPRLLLQSARPLGQVVPQTPPVHVAMNPTGAPQFISQPPQCSGSLMTSTHDVPHSTVPGGHVVMHTPAEQTLPVAHGVPHAPQFAADVMSASHPLDAT